MTKNRSGVDYRLALAAAALALALIPADVRAARSANEKLLQLSKLPGECTAAVGSRATPRGAAACRTALASRGDELKAFIVSKEARQLRLISGDIATEARCAVVLDILEDNHRALVDVANYLAEEIRPPQKDPSARARGEELGKKLLPKALPKLENELDRQATAEDLKKHARSKLVEYRDRLKECGVVMNLVLVAGPYFIPGEIEGKVPALLEAIQAGLADSKDAERATNAAEAMTGLLYTLEGAAFRERRAR